MTIPIQNIYYLLAYAWGYTQDEDLAPVDAIDSPEVVDLFALLLARHTERLVRRGIGRTYVEFLDDLSTVRGRLCTHDAQFELRLRSCQVRCRFDELDVDTPANRVLKATLSLLIRTGSLDGGLREELVGLRRWFSDVSDAPVTPRTLRSVPRHRNNRPYHFPLQICEMLWKNSMPSEETGEAVFVDFQRDESQMAHLWEEFLRAFFRRHASGWNVGRRHMKWVGVAGDEEARRLLPAMKTDVDLDRPGQRRIFEAKYSTTPLAVNQFGEKRLISGHLYQVMAYARNATLAAAEGSAVTVGLLYAAVGTGFDYRYELHGVPVAVVGIDLARPWREIESDLLGLVG